MAWPYVLCLKDLKLADYVYAGLSGKIDLFLLPHPKFSLVLLTVSHY